MSGSHNLATPTATATGAAYPPALHADASVTVPTALSTSQAYPPEITTTGFARQRINKSGTYVAPFGGARAQVPGWVSDTTYPAVIVSDALVVSGGGACTIATSISRSASTDSMTIYLMRDLTQLASFSVSSSGSTSWSGTVTDGDRITLEVSASGGTPARRTITDGFIDVTPD